MEDQAYTANEVVTRTLESLLGVLESDQVGAREKVGAARLVHEMVCRHRELFDEEYAQQLEQDGVATWTPARRSQGLS